MDDPWSVHPNVTWSIWDASDWILMKPPLDHGDENCHCFIVAFYKLF